MDHSKDHWHVDPDPRADGCWQVCREVNVAGTIRSETICFIATGMDEEETESVSNTIAAAPDLLAACEKMLAWAIQDDAPYHGQPIGDDSMGDEFLADVEFARAAIAKATGK